MPLHVPWSDRAWLGLRHFNDRDYFEAHEVWEDIWMDARGPVRLFYQALIQVAVGCYKADFGVHNGAVRLLRRALDKFEALGPVDAPFETDRFVTDTRNFLALVERAGPDGLRDLESGLYPAIWSGGEKPMDAAAHGGVVGGD